MKKGISEHTRIRLSARRLNSAIRQKEQIRRAAAEFRFTSWQAAGCMSPSLRDIILESVWYISDRREWVNHLHSLTMQMKKRARQYYHQPDRRPWILMGGSPVIFPNEKLPNLLEASGLYLADRVDSVALQSDIPCAACGHSVNKILGRMAELRMGMETSGA